MTAPVQALFAPFRLGNLELPTRVVMAPMTRSFSPGFGSGGGGDFGGGGASGDW